MGMGDDIEKLFSTAWGTVSEAEKKVKDVLNPNKNGLTSSVYGVSGALNQIMQVMFGVVSPFVKVQNAAIDLAKTLGLAGESIMSNSMNLIEQNRKMQLSASYGISTEEMMKLETSVLMGLGRNVRIENAGMPGSPDDSTLANVVAASQVLGTENVEKIIAGYDKLGISMKTAAKATGKLYKEAGEYGINLQKYTQNFTENLHMAQMYNFRNGVNGLKEMARKATEIRQDMKQIAAFADKVGSVTGAVETAANLQVLGGSFAALANPLTMLNKSLTDVNGLQDMFTGMTAGAATYNSVTHEIEMDPVTRQIMKRAAESMGVDANNFIDQAYSQARRAEITNQMSGVGGLSTELEKLLPNIGEIDSETGAAGATIDGEFKTLAEISASPELQNRLLETTVSESEDIKNIAKSVMGIQQIMTGKAYQLENGLASNIVKEGSVKGASINDIVVDFLTKSVDEKTIAAATKLDGFLQDLSTNWFKFASDTVTQLIKPFDDFGDPKAFAASLGESMSNIFGEGARDLGSQTGNMVGNFVNSMDAKLQEYGFSPMVWFRKEDEGHAIGTQMPLEDNAQARNSVALAARDVSIQAASFSLNGGENTRIQPTEGTETSRAAAAVHGSNTQVLDIVQALAGSAGYTVITAPLNPEANDHQPSVKIEASPESIPGATVSPDGNKTQATIGQQAEARQNGGNEPYTLNITGTLTMNVNGDNGKIGTVDIMKMLENNSTFRQELAKALADTYAKMDKSGLVSN